MIIEDEHRLDHSVENIEREKSAQTIVSLALSLSLFLASSVKSPFVGLQFMRCNSAHP